MVFLEINLCEHTTHRLEGKRERRNIQQENDLSGLLSRRHPRWRLSSPQPRHATDESRNLALISSFFENRIGILGACHSHEPFHLR